MPLSLREIGDLACCCASSCGWPAARGPVLTTDQAAALAAAEGRWKRSRARHDYAFVYHPISFPALGNASARIEVRGGVVKSVAELGRHEAGRDHHRPTVREHPRGLEERPLREDRGHVTTPSSVTRPASSSPRPSTSVTGMSSSRSNHSRCWHANRRRMPASGATRGRPNISRSDRVPVGETWRSGRTAATLRVPGDPRRTVARNRFGPECARDARPRQRLQYPVTLCLSGCTNAEQPIFSIFPRNSTDSPDLTGLDQDPAQDSLPPQGRSARRSGFPA